MHFSGSRCPTLLTVVNKHQPRESILLFLCVPITDVSAIALGQLHWVGCKRGVTRGEITLRSDTYILDKMRRRVLAGLTPEETFEFELLDAQIPFDGKPICPSIRLSLSQTEHRWLELFEKMKAARRFRVVSRTEREVVETRKFAEGPRCAKPVAPPFPGGLPEDAT